MNYRLLTDAEIARCVPQAKYREAVVAAVAELDPEGAVYEDTLIALCSNGHLVAHGELDLPLTDLEVLLDLLRAKKRARDEGNKEADRG